MKMDPDQVEALFTRADGTYLCARWGRPIVPVVFGVDDATLAVFKGAIEAVVALARHQMAETDPEAGAGSGTLGGQAGGCGCQSIPDFPV